MAVIKASFTEPVVGDAALAFAKMVQSQFSKIRANVDMNKTFAALRNTLLPKRISAELRVCAEKKADQEVRMSMTIQELERWLGAARKEIFR